MTEKKGPRQKLPWLQQQNLHPSFETIRVDKWDEINNFRMDRGCYVLIRIHRRKKEIGVAICDYQHSILKEFAGRRAIDLYNAIFRYDEDHKKGWFTRFDHAAYLGKELKKAEIALSAGKSYYQE